MANLVDIFPARANVGKDIVTPERVNEKFAEKLVKTGLWTYTPKPSTQDDLSLMLNEAKKELSNEKQSLAKERAELEAMKAEIEKSKLQTVSPVKQKKAEV